MGYLKDRYLSTLMVQRCIMEAVQRSTSRQIQARHATAGNGKYPENKNKNITSTKYYYVDSTTIILYVDFTSV